MGPMCFDYGFGPFRWVCGSGDAADLDKTDAIACEVLEGLMLEAPSEIQQQMADNVQWIRGAKANKLVVGSQARILYADAEGRMRIAKAFNQAIASGELSGPVILGRDHHDVSGTDSPYRETSTSMTAPHSPRTWRSRILSVTRLGGPPGCPSTMEAEWAGVK